MAKAAVFVGDRAPFELRELPLPEPEPNWILVKIRLSSVCGSDLHRWRGERKTPVPSILGHESTGEVYQLGSNVKADYLGEPLEIGDRIVHSYFYPCGRCYSCLGKQPTTCIRRTALNGSIPCDSPPYFNGSFGEYLYLRQENAVFKVPNELSDDVVAPLNCALSTLVFGLDKVGVQFGDRVVVQGAGALGLYTAALAKEMGASKVIVIDLVDERLRMAEEFGADHTINALEFKEDKDRINEVKRLTNNHGADLVIEVAGTPKVVPEGLHILRNSGRYLEVGCVYEGSMASLDISRIALGGLKVVGTLNYEPWCIPKALEFLRRTREKYPFERILGRKFRLNQINEAFEAADKTTVTRAAIVP